MLLELPSPGKNTLTGLKHKEIQNSLDITRLVIDTATERTSVLNSKRPHILIISYSGPALKSTFVTSTPMCLVKSISSLILICP